LAQLAERGEEEMRREKRGVDSHVWTRVERGTTYILISEPIGRRERVSRVKAAGPDHHPCR